jgi:ethanolamine transporter EutH
MKKVLGGIWAFLQICIIATLSSFIVKPVITLGTAFVLGLLDINFSNNEEFIRNLDAIGNIAPFILAIYIWNKFIKNRKENKK